MKSSNNAQPKNELSSSKKNAFLVFSGIVAALKIVVNIGSEAAADKPGELLGFALAPFAWAAIGVFVYRKLKNTTNMKSFKDQFIIVSFVLTILTVLSNLSNLSTV